MPKPAVWHNEPECGHDVTCAYQTHYCTYIRVPRLLTLQNPQTPDPSTLPSVAGQAPDRLLLITAHQWHELWFKVLLADLRAALAASSTLPSVAGQAPIYEPVKLLKRGIELFKLFEHHADVCETIIVRELGLKKDVRVPAERVTGASGQFTQLAALSRQLPRLSRTAAAGQRGGGYTYPGLWEAAEEYAARFKAFRARYQKFLKATLIPHPERSAVERRAVEGYAGWLRLPDLLSLQDGVKAAWTEVGQPPAALMPTENMSADENMFVVVHQCFEIWFKVVLDHVDRALPLVLSGKIAEATRLLRRVVLIQRLLVQQIQIPATMLPLDFFRFRDQRLERDGKVFKTGLSPASGTESYQFREIEIVCGLRDDPVFQKYLKGTDKLPIRLLTPRQRERLQQTTLPEAFRQAARQRGLQTFDEIFTPADVPNPHADLARLADTLIEFDEFFRFWRFGHVSMVEKMIGAKSGTGFLGPEYLMETAGIRIQEKNRVFEEKQVRPRFFEELWAVRTRMSSY